MKFLKIFLIFCFVVLSHLNFFELNKSEKNILSKTQARLANNSQDEIEKELDEDINNQLDDIDFSGLEEILNSLDKDSKNLFKESSFLNLLKKFISGENIGLYENFGKYSLSMIFQNVLNLLPFFAIIIAIAIVYSLLEQFASEKNKSVSTLTNIVCFSSITIIVLKIVVGLIFNVTNSINIIQSQMEIVFPIILTLITSVGNVVTASTFQPALAILSAGITKLFVDFLIPIFIFTLVFNIAGNISKDVKLEKFSKFFSSLFNWVVGIVFTIFIAFLAIQGLTVSTFDSISLKTTKFAIKSYLPIIGSYISDGASLIIASSILIKNALGATGIVLLFSTVLSPLINIIVVILLFKLTSAILEPIVNSKISNFLFSVSKTLNLLTVSLISIGFMYLITVSILMSCSNIF